MKMGKSAKPVTPGSFTVAEDAERAIALYHLYRRRGTWFTRHRLFRLRMAGSVCEACSLLESCSSPSVPCCCPFGLALTVFPNIDCFGASPRLPPRPFPAQISHPILVSWVRTHCQNPCCHSRTTVSRSMMSNGLPPNIPEVLT